jgi:hypothetical protein
MKKVVLKTVLTIVSLALLNGCGGRREVYNQALDILGPFPVSGGLCFLNRTLSEIVRLRVTDDGLTIDRSYLRYRPLKIIEVDNDNRLAVLHDGRAQPGIAMLDPLMLHEQDFLPLSEQFDSLALAPTSRFGVAYFSGTSSNPQGIRNLNQIQIVDFSSPQAHPPLALETGGLSPRGIDFLPAGSGDFDDIAVVRVDNGLVLIDMRNAAQEPLWVRFTNSPGGLSVPAEVVFGSFYANGGYIFVRLQGGDDVLSIRLTREDGFLKRTINFLNVPADSFPTDLTVLGDGQFDDKVFIVYGSSQGKAAILDANAIQTDEMIFDFGLPVTQSRLLLADDRLKRFVAVFNSNSSSGRLYLVDPETGDSQTVYLQDAFEQVSGPEDGSYLVVFHPSLGDTQTPGMRVIRMARHPTSGKYTHRIATYALTKDISSFAFTGNGMNMLASLYSDTVTFVLDLDSGEYLAMELDKQPLATGLIPKTNWSYFHHAHPLGSVTFVPLEHFDRARAVMLEGFVMEGLLDPR